MNFKLFGFGDSVWVSANGGKTKIADMSDTHVRNALGMIVRRLNEGDCAYSNDKGAVRFAPLMKELVDNSIAFVDDDDKLRVTYPTTHWSSK